jgi:hypothetical protein
MKLTDAINIIASLDRTIALDKQDTRYGMLSATEHQALEKLVNTALQVNHVVNLREI